jgi:Tfp pilus assembly protein PilF
LGILWVRKGELLNAKSSFEMALKDAPNLANAQENLASVYLLLSQATLLKAQSLEPQSKAIPIKLKSIANLIDQFSSLSPIGIH